MKINRTVPVTITGEMDWPPEMRFTMSGRALLHISVGGQLCQAWDALAEMLADTMPQTGSVTVTGRMKTERWKDKDQVEHSRDVLMIDTITW